MGIHTEIGTENMTLLRNKSLKENITLAFPYFIANGLKMSTKIAFKLVLII